MIFVPDKIRDREACEFLLDCYFHFHITAVVFLKEDPFFIVMLGKVPGASAVCLGRFARLAEIADQVFAFLRIR